MPIIENGNNNSIMFIYEEGILFSIENVNGSVRTLKKEILLYLLLKTFF